MMHQHIHMHGILAPKFAWIDSVFPYVLDPLVGHTWNSYYYHHVKHHHVENNGPGDLSSTIQYQRDSAFDFFCYFLRFFMCIWAELPLYFLKKGRYAMAAKGVAGDAGTFVMIALLATYVNLRATTFVFMIPLLALRLGLMIGNWGQHAFVDEVDPDSDYRSSITLIDVAVSLLSFMVRRSALILIVASVQPLLLQRRLPHLSPSQPSPSLARSSSVLPLAKAHLRQRASSRLLQY